VKFAIRRKAAGGRGVTGYEVLLIGSSMSKGLEGKSKAQNGRETNPWESVKALNIQRLRGIAKRHGGMREEGKGGEWEKSMKGTMANVRGTRKRCEAKTLGGGGAGWGAEK